MSRIRRSRAAIALLLLLGGATAAFAYAWHPAIGEIPAPGRQTFKPEQIARGAELAAIGDCTVCHTAETGRPYAGGRAVPTPFGTVYATNVTPDPETGIGQWSEPAFRRAMRDGIDRAGRHLYPVLPYPHFTRASDADIEAMYAFLMTREPVRQAAPANQLPFPLDQRIVLAGWNLLYLRPGPWQSDPAHDAAWNRGGYLVEAIGHCGACHTPHNALGAEQGAQALGGGAAEGWYAPALRTDSPARNAWTKDALATYLHTGFEQGHGAAAGPMTAVTAELASVPLADIDAIATYIALTMPQATATSPSRAVQDTQAQAMFAGACGACHADDAPMTRGGAPSLALSTSVNAPTPQGVIQALLRGIPWREGSATPYMPAFATALTDEQVAGIAGYLRQHFSDKPAWPDLPAQVKAARREGGA